MKPNRTNYEMWIIDYLDGKLDQDNVRELFIFLEQNPDLKDEFTELQNTVLTSDISYSGKNLLKKRVTEIPDPQFELLCVASSEGDITSEQKEELAEIISAYPDKKRDLELIEKIRLVPPAIRFPRKASLKHFTLQQKVIRLSLAVGSAAAGIAVLMFLFNTSGINNDDQSVTIARNSSSGKFETPVRIKKEEPVIRKEIAINNLGPKTDIKNPLDQEITAKKSDTIFLPAITDSVVIQPDMNRVKLTRAEFIHEVNIPVADISSGLKLASISLKQIPVTFEKPGVSGYFALFVREKILKSKTPETGNLKGYEVAETGILGLNKLLGWDMSLKQNRNEQGELKSLYFSSRIIKFNTPVKKVMASL